MAGFQRVGVGKQVTQPRLLVAEAHILEAFAAGRSVRGDAVEAVGHGGQVGGGLEVPAGHEVQHAGAGHALGHGGQIGLLCRALMLLADERRIAQDVAQPRWRHKR